MAERRSQAIQTAKNIISECRYEAFEWEEGFESCVNAILGRLDRCEKIKKLNKNKFADVMKQIRISMGMYDLFGDREVYENLEFSRRPEFEAATYKQIEKKIIEFINQN